ncbi:MAG: aromatic ring-hydroxylating oxygenase subunit alpha, partial [Alphaproteobacteria bacterium]
MTSSNVLKAEFARPLSDDAELSYTLPSSYYTDPAIYELEKEKIFARSWIFLCHISQVAEPGAYVAGEVADQPVFVVRDRKGELRGYH